MSRLRDASRAVGRGSTGEALMLLWNELEPARLAGDEGRLAGIESLAAAIVARGDEGDRREAEQLLETLERYRGEPGGGPVTARVEGDLVVVGEPGYGDVGESGGPYETAEPPGGEPAEGQGRRGLGGLLWLVLLGAIVLFNLLGDLLNR